MDQRTAITIRFPSDLLDDVKQALADGESINGFVVAAVERAVQRRQGLKAHERIIAINQRLKTGAGPQPSAAELVRELRDGLDRRA